MRRKLQCRSLGLPFSWVICDILADMISPVWYYLINASVAQGIEHRSPKAGVGGSNPSWGTIAG